MGSDEHWRRQQVTTWDTHRAHWQAIRNERPVPPRFDQRAFSPPVPVTAWLYWERDGLEVVDTSAQAWAGRDVLVAVHDLRWRLLGVWLPVQDVRPVR